jgi:hypothetical protein
MRQEHLSGHELDVLIGGGAVEEASREHAASCLHCQARLEAVAEAIRASRLPGPDEAVRERAREAALEVAGQRRRPATPWLWAAAAALAVAALSPFALRSNHSAAPVDATKVLAQVNTVLDQDPVTSVFSSDVVSVIAPNADGSEEGSTS